MTAPWAMGITETARALAARELSVHDLVSSVLGRLRQTEPCLHAWAFVDEASALRAAERADREIAAGRHRGPLHGIPFAVKDVIDTAGWPTEGGSRAYAGRVPTCDAATVRHLRHAGAIPLGKTVTHELAYGQDTPTTKNPWDATRYPGGSSVGSGVAVAVGSAHAALGTDTGGSIRNPAAINGLVGLRPTSGLVDCAGTMHLSPTLDQVGPIARDVADCSLLLSAMVAPGTWPGDADPLEAVRSPVRQPRIGVDFAAWQECGVSATVFDVVARAVKDMQQAGVEVVELSLPELALGLPITLAVCAAEAARSHREVLKHRAGDLDPRTRIMLELGLISPAADVAAAYRARERLRAAVLAAFRRHGLHALVSPTLPATAPALTSFATDLTRESGPDDLSGALRLLSPANVLGYPGLSVPCGQVGGLPVGLHLLGLAHGDLTLLRLAYQYERLSGWALDCAAFDICTPSA